MSALKHAKHSGHKCDFTNKHKLRTTKNGMNQGRNLALLSIEKRGGIIVWAKSHWRF